MAGRRQHPGISGLLGLVTLEAVAFGVLFLLMLREEGPAIGVELTPIGAVIGVAVLLLVLAGGAWCTWRVWSGRWGLGQPAVSPPLRKSPPPAPRKPEAPPVLALEEPPPSRVDEPPVLAGEESPPPKVDQPLAPSA
jgi:hypothetical protein